MGRRRQHRRRRLRRGAPLHHRMRVALDARLPRRRPAAGRRARAGRHHRHRHPRGTRHRDRPPGSRVGPATVADRRKRPQRRSADHPARSARLRSCRAMGRRYPPRHSHRGIRRTARLLCGFRLARHACADAAPRLLPRRHVFVVPAASARAAAGHPDDPGHSAARVHLHPRPGRQSRARGPSVAEFVLWPAGDQGRVGARVALHGNAFHGRGMGSVDTVPVLQLASRTGVGPRHRRGT